jgi:hypothetical protein
MDVLVRKFLSATVLTCLFVGIDVPGADRNVRYEQVCAKVFSEWRRGLRGGIAGQTSDIDD